MRHPASDAMDATGVWSGIWFVRSEHDKEAEWIDRLENKLRGKSRQQNVSVTLEDVVASVRRMPYWKAPGPET